jgi:hypothetical protein
MERRRKNTRKLCQDSQYLNLGPPEYEERLLTIRPPCSVLGMDNRPGGDHSSTEIQPHPIIKIKVYKAVLQSFITATCCIIQGVQNITKPMAYLESVFPGRFISKSLWPPRSPDLSPPPQTSFYGGISRILCIQIIHTHYKSFRPTFSALWTGYQLAHCKTCSLT